MKHKLFSRFISVLLAVVMLASLMSMSSLATDDVQEPDPAVTSGEQMTDSTESDVADPTADPAAQSDEITDEGDEDTSSGDNTDETVVSGEENDETVVSDEENDENVVSDEENSEEPVPGEEEATVPSEEEAVSNDEAASSDEEEDASSQEETAPAAVQLTAEAKDENDNVVANVTAEADEGVIPEGASLVADLLTGNDAETAAAELDEAGVEYDGYMALDIHLEDANGNEVEPNGEVRVVMVAPAALPEDADPTTVAVQHHEEQDNGEVQVKELASSADTAPVALAASDSASDQPAAGVTADNGDVTAEFAVERFSTFTITWKESSGETSATDKEDANDLRDASFLANSGLSPVDTVDTSDNIEIELYDYDQESINTGHTLKFGGNGEENFNKWSSYEAGLKEKKYEWGIPFLADVTFEGIFQDIVSAKGVKGTSANDQNQYYPQLNQTVTGSNESLAYLFNDSLVQGKTSYEGLNHLFLKSEFDQTGYYVYNSADNFATLRNERGQIGTNFKVYNTATTDSDGARFMPFNDIYADHYNTGKYPISGDKNYYYGMHIGFEMLQTADGKVENPGTGLKDDMIFEFNGDDDLWVFIDGVLVLDLGGIHGAAGGEINFSTGDVTAGTGDVKVYLSEDYPNGTYFTDTFWREPYRSGVKTWKEETTIKDLLQAADPTLENSDFEGDTFTDWSTHRVDIYYLERGAGKSNCELKFNIQAIPTGSLTVGKTAVGAQEGLNYKFQVTDSEGNPVANTPYQKNGTDTTENTTDNNGVFTLQSGEYAVFSDLEQGNYTVEELEGDGYNLSDFTVVTNGQVDNKATVTVEEGAVAMVSVTNTAVEKGNGSLQITKSFETNDGKPAAIPDDLAKIVLTVTETYQHEKYKHEVELKPAVDSEGNKVFSGTLDGVRYYTEIAVQVENMLNSSGQPIANAADWSMGEFILNRYATENVDATFHPSKSEDNQTYTLPNSGYVLVSDRGNWYLVMNHVPEGTDAKQTFKDMVIDKILKAVEEVSGGPEPSNADAVELLSVDEAANKYNATVSFADGGNAVIKFADQSAWSIFYFGTFDMTNVTMQATLTNILNTGAKIEIPVTKVWPDGTSDVDSVTVILTDEQGTQHSVELNTDNNWKGKFEDLPKYDSDGNLITYTAEDIQEVKVEGYDSEVTGDMETGFTVTNTPSKGYLTINKVLANGSQKLNNGKDVFSFKIQAVDENNDTYGTVWYMYVDGNGAATLDGTNPQLELPAGNYKITELSNINYTCGGATAAVNGVQQVTSLNETITVEVGGNAVTAVTYTNTVQDKGFTDGSGVINKFSSDENGVITFDRITIAGDKEEKDNWKQQESTDGQQN